MGEEYRKALRRGERDLRHDASAGVYPYLPALDSVLAPGDTVGEVRLGTMEIPLEMVVGTRTEGRQRTFSRTFMPVLAPTTEFAFKWSRLYDIQTSEGFRDPVKVYEYMHRFYVQEGNKRVSVMSYVGAYSIEAEVTRLLPRQWDAPERRLYGEFLEFWRAVPTYEIEFSREGSYRRLATLMGRDLDKPWPDDAVCGLTSTYEYFRSLCQRAGGSHLDITCGDALLAYLSYFPDERLLDTPPSIVVERIGRLWSELALAGPREDVVLVSEPSAEPSSHGALSRLSFRTPYSQANPLRLAFLYEKPLTTSSWARAHDAGRLGVERRFNGLVQTTAFDACASPGDFSAVVDVAVEHGAQAIFSCSPTLMTSTAKAAIAHPEVRFLNCSCNLPHSRVRSYYGRMYEAKFVTGALAASFSTNHRVGYQANVPMFGSVAEINAFAIGAALVDPEVKVRLVWSTRGGDSLYHRMADEGVTVMSGSDVTAPWDDSCALGLYQMVNGRVHNLALPVWNWGRYYELIVQGLLNGSWQDTDGEGRPWAVSYWYGMSAGVIGLRLSDDLPYYSRKLVEQVTHGIERGVLDPFAGELRSQLGVVQPAGSPRLKEQDVVSMSWLNDNIEGTLPENWHPVDETSVGGGLVS
ncbi:BMP family ABC transporter substrate-binding protein [Olsenella sp. Marseille-P4559]|uniref:BMP family ABC transporter substrate-binding protein n=1 Tax=Olsenella sp. Marseille-P4559 TaxID=2364795 RepID=UPI0010322C49|nr:BMP family ABC transporter substrate-binding protein [Olsenella sp. Marseille-P4559]